MTLYSSKTPRDLNHDPKPWQQPWPGQRRSNVPEKRYGDTPADAWTWNPRPEFDHAQHNEPNPILIAFRGFAGKHGMAPDEVCNLAQQWVKRATYYEHRLNIRARSATKAQREHARHVLTRLAQTVEEES